MRAPPAELAADPYSAEQEIPRTGPDNWVTVPVGEMLSFGAERGLLVALYPVEEGHIDACDIDAIAEWGLPVPDLNGGFNEGLRYVRGEDGELDKELSEDEDDDTDMELSADEEYDTDMELSADEEDDTDMELSEDAPDQVEQARRYREWMAAHDGAQPGQGRGAQPDEVQLAVWMSNLKTRCASGAPLMSDVVAVLDEGMEPGWWRTDSRADHQVKQARRYREWMAAHDGAQPGWGRGAQPDEHQLAQWMTHFRTRSCAAGTPWMSDVAAVLDEGMEPGWWRAAL
ncbi:unnamed protein product [Pedinophyceae sp. YPF-701]|nr:unnamed protein product [Pedinophyceae sp. YPF-701]